MLLFLCIIKVAITRPGREQNENGSRASADRAGHLLFAAIATVQFISVVRTGYARSRASCAGSFALLLISALKIAGTSFAGRQISNVIGNPL
jgi:hypothetical protein